MPSDTGFLVLSLIVSSGNVKAFYWFPLQHPVEGLQASAALLLATLSLVTLPLYLLYPLGSRRYDCPDPFLSIALVNLGNAPGLEWCDMPSDMLS